MNFTQHDRKELHIGTTGRRKGNAESRELVKCIQRLKYQESLLERKLQTFINDAKLDPDVMQKIRNMSEESTKRLEDFKNLQRSVRIIAKELEYVKSLLADDIGKLDVDMFKKRLMKLAQKIHDVKQSLNPGYLCDEQNGLESEINTFIAKCHIR